MFKKLLVANRGEIAVRIIRACKELGIKTVAVYSEADANALHTQLADEAVCIGPALAKDSYLKMERILSATLASGADAIHPGFGFLSENSKFADLCAKCKIAFIGPSGKVIDLMGNKSEARNTMIAAGVPVVPGTKEPVFDGKIGKTIADEIGYPVIIKASAGGGGKGMRIVKNASEFEHLFETARQEAKNAFGDPTMYIEKYIEGARHIEFQILADKYGNVVHLGERDCSIQRRHQKMIEEAPSSAIGETLRREMGEAAVKAAIASNYENAGTIEFILDKYGNYYFIEMNTRIQVEHGVTELVTGIDLVKEQIRIAAGEALSFSQEEIKITGHAIECRINAECPERNFLPSPGTVTNLRLPGGNGVRVDTALYSGYTIPAMYDSLVAKLMVYDKTRDEAIQKMSGALEELIIEGIDTNTDFLYELIHNSEFKMGKIDTGFVERVIAK
ncbi:acetyl-CoA carboxylase biotin carboxylase subunit [Clostridium sp. Marseille-P299]|uniref:acetyl-CoA carboxylase biotin carboxylase subunit n=1 Tax=Clostridium sp. Marseille-P299 TaxID=1805477 RepID=UPI00082F317F|nr:acetyl-CoA carboxylase biotin carboxylase subunit [Clostridium sp. Marseille-P299]